MILVISGTNRPNSRTALVANHTYNYLKKKNEEVRLLDLQEYDEELIHSEMYDGNKLSPKLTKFQDETFIPAQKLIIISPEYNGSYAGILKLFFDAISVRKYNETFRGKKVALVGVASGRAGNLRGMEHLTGFLNYLKMLVYPVKVPISSIENLISNDKLDSGLTEPLQLMIDDFVLF